MAESMVAYAQPLLDETDGSTDQINNALSIAQMCWNLALLPEKDREESLGEMRPGFKMEVDEFEDFRQSVIVPMIRRHREMFPNMPRLDSQAPASLSPGKKYPGTGRNAPRAIAERSTNGVVDDESTSCCRQMSLENQAEQAVAPYR